MEQHYEDDNIYYDNMEIMEKIEQRKIQEVIDIKAKHKIQKQNNVNPTEKPPALPPKKKNLPKSSNNIAKKESESPKVPKTQEAIHNRQQQLVKEKKPEPQPQTQQTCSHPQLLRTRSIVDEPLSPIMEEESVLGDSPHGSLHGSDDELSEHPSQSASDTFHSDDSSSVFYESFSDQANVKNNNTNFNESRENGKSTNKTIQNGITDNNSISDSGGSGNSRSSSQKSKDNSQFTQNTKTGSGGSFPNSYDTSSIDDESEQDGVQPYGMVDLAQLDEAENKRKIPPKPRIDARQLANQNRDNLHKLRQHSRNQNAPREEINEYDNLDEYNGRHSTAVSSLDKQGIQRPPSTASPKSLPKNMTRSSNVKNEEQRTNRRTLSDSREKRDALRRKELQSIQGQRPRSSSDRSDSSVDKRMKGPALPPKPAPKVLPIPVNVKEEDLFKDDVNLYEEIQPRDEEERNHVLQTDAMEKAWDDIQEILESMEIPDFGDAQPKSKTLSTKRFPVSQQYKQYEPPQYDNFADLMSNQNLQTTPVTARKMESPLLPKQNPPSPKRKNSFGSLSSSSYRSELSHKYDQQNTTNITAFNSPNTQNLHGMKPHENAQDNLYVNDKQFRQDDLDEIIPSDIDTRYYEGPRENRNQAPPPLPAPRKSFAKSQSSGQLVGNPKSKLHVMSRTNSGPSILIDERYELPANNIPENKQMYRKSKSLDEKEKSASSPDGSLPRRMKSRESDGDSGMFSQNVTDEGLAMKSGSQYSDESMLDTSESLKGSTKSLGRIASRERKKSPLRSKFKFRVRSKSQERFQSDSGSVAQQSGNSDVDDDAKGRRRKGSRLSRRISRKTAERRGRSADRSKSGDEDESRGRNPVNFIRKLLRKSREPAEEISAPMQDFDVEAHVANQNLYVQSPVEKAPSVTSQPERHQKPLDPPREKQLISPPSRRARKMLHSRRAREYASSSDEDDSDVITNRRDGYDQRNAKLGGQRPDHHNSFRNQRRNSPSTSDSEEDYRPSYENNRGGNGFDDYSGRRKSGTRYDYEKDDKAMRDRNQRTRIQHPRRRHSDKRRNYNDGTQQPSNNASQQHEKYRTLVSLNAQTLKKITEKWLTEWRNQLPVGGFLITSWSDVVLASKRPQCILGKTVLYVAHFSTNPDHKLACQMFDQKDINSRLIRQLENCSTLTAHPNLCSVCSHFPCQVPGSLINPAYGDRPVKALCVVLANVPAMSLAEYLQRLGEEKEPKQVHKQILLMLLQLLQAMDNLSSSGFSISCIKPDHLVVTQERGLLQILPHMDCADENSTENDEGFRRLPIMQQIAKLVSWMLQIGTDIHNSRSQKPAAASPHLFALKKIVYILTEQPQNLDSRAIQSIAQCALWGPMTSEELDLGMKNTYEALEMWVDMKQAKLVNSIAVLFSGKSNSVPIYMFYKHQYFSQINPESLFQNLRTLQRI
ncbi:uncharacterized protein LOC120341528 [Styela clava]